MPKVDVNKMNSDRSASDRALKYLRETEDFDPYKLDKGQQWGMGLSALASVFTRNKKPFQGFMSSMEKINQQEMAAHQAQLANFRAQMDAVAHQKNMQTQELRMKQTQGEMDWKAKQEEAWRKAAKFRSEQVYEDEKRKHEMASKKVEAFGKFAEKWGGAAIPKPFRDIGKKVIGKVTEKVTGAIGERGEEKATEEMEMVRETGAFGPESLRQATEMVGYRTPAEQEAAMVQAQKDWVDFQTKITEMKQKAFDLEQDKLLAPAEAAKLIADIDRIEASTYSAYKSGNASAALTALRDAQAETEGIETLIKTQEFLGGGAGGMDYAKWVGFGKEKITVNAKKHIGNQLRNSFVDGYQESVDLAARAISEQNWSSVDEYMKMVKDIVGEYNKSVSPEQLLASYRLDYPDDFAAKFAKSYAKLGSDAKSRVSNYILLEGYVVDDDKPGNFIKRNDTADAIKKDIEKFRVEIESTLGITEAGVETLEDEWLK